ncbi:hypothetical protein CKA32_006047 [Geitlerinema sp. FC II]|nr:hypothetical protein CKA32_006047 [Geitlerinema sp. FC II]
MRSAEFFNILDSLMVENRTPIEVFIVGFVGEFLVEIFCYKSPQSCCNCLYNLHDFYLNNPDTFTSPTMKFRFRVPR